MFLHPLQIVLINYGKIVYNYLMNMMMRCRGETYFARVPRSGHFIAAKQLFYPSTIHHIGLSVLRSPFPCSPLPQTGRPQGSPLPAFRADDRHHLLFRRQPARVSRRTVPPGVAALRALPRATDIVAPRATDAISYIIFIIIYSLFIIHCLTFPVSLFLVQSKFYLDCFIPAGFACVTSPH